MIAGDDHARKAHRHCRRQRRDRGIVGIIDPVDTGRGEQHHGLFRRAVQPLRSPVQEVVKHVGIGGELLALKPVWEQAFIKVEDKILAVAVRPFCRQTKQGWLRIRRAVARIICSIRAGNHPDKYAGSQNDSKSLTQCFLHFLTKFQGVKWVPSFYGFVGGTSSVARARKPRGFPRKLHQARAIDAEAGAAAPQIGRAPKAKRDIDEIAGMLGERPGYARR